MANVSIAFVVPTSNTTSAAVSVATMGPDKELIIGGGEFEANVSLEISPDGVRWSTVWTATQPGRYPLSFAAVSARIKVSGYQSGTPLADMNAEIGVATGLVLNVPAGDGTGTALDVSALTDFKTIVVAGAFTGQVLVEVSGDGVTYAPLPITFTAPDNFTITSPCTWMRLVRSGVSGGSAPTAGVASSQTTPSSSAGGGGSFVPLGSEEVTSSTGGDPPVTITSRMGNGLLVNPASPAAIDDDDLATPFITIQGAVDAIVNQGVANLTTALTRWIVFVAPGCYDEAVTVATTQIPAIDFVAMGGVTLGTGRSNANGGSATPRDFTWQLDGQNLTGVQPRLSFSTMTPALNGLYDNLDAATEFGAPSAMNGWRISGDLVVEDLAEATLFTGFAHVYATNMVCENMTGVVEGASIVLFLDNVRVAKLVSFPENGGASGNGFLWAARMCKFGAEAGADPTLTAFDVYSIVYAKDCVWFGNVTMRPYNNSPQSPSGLVNCGFGSPGGTATFTCLGNDALFVDASTLQSILFGGGTSTFWNFTTNTAKLNVRDGVSVLPFGNTDIASAAGAVFLTPGFESAAAGAADTKQLPIAGSATGAGAILLGFSVRHNLAAGNGADVTYELLVNGASASPAISGVLATGAVGQLHVTTQARAAAGARLSLRATKPGGGIADGVQNVTAVARYVSAPGAI